MSAIHDDQEETKMHATRLTVMMMAKSSRRIVGALAVMALAGLSSTTLAEMTLTPEGIAEGFTLTTFATNFPSVGGVGPEGITFPGSGVMVADGPGNVRVLPSHADGQDASTVAPTAFYGDGNAIGLAELGGKFYMTQRTLGQVLQVNPDGTSNQVIVSNLNPATGIVGDPFTGHLFVSDFGGVAIFEVDPVAKTAIEFKHVNPDGLALSSDGRTLYAALDGLHIVGYDIVTKAQVFDSGQIGNVDGIALGAGPLSGKIFGNTNFGELWEVDLTTTNQTLIASGGSRGDFVTVDPSNGTLLLTQTDRILRVGPEGRFGPFTFALTPAVATNNVGQTHTVTVTVTTNSTPAANILVTNVVTGANTALGACLTDTNGMCTFSYTGLNAGDDIITAQAFLAGEDRTATATKTWVGALGCTITCPGDIVVPSETNLCGATVNYGVGTAGTCPDVVCTPPPGSVFAVGTTAVNCTTNTDTVCAFNVTVQDMQLPTITCPDNISTNVPSGQTSIAITFGSAASDNCSLAGAPVCSPPSGSSFGLGTTPVTCTATDSAGNSNTCGFTVTVTQLGGNQPPVALCQNVTKNADANCQATVLASEVDNGSTDPDGTITDRTLTPPGPYLLGTNQVILTVTDDQGASSTCTATVAVVDKTPPTITCPANITTNVGLSATGAVVNYNAPVVSDNCGVASTNCSPASGSTFVLGTNTVACTVVDTSGNTGNCSFQLIVTAAAANQPPVARCQDLTINASANCATDIPAIALDSGSFDPDGTITNRTLTPPGPYLLGTNQVILTVTDNQGASASCTAILIVVDTTPPTITCPANITTSVGINATGAVVNYNAPVVSDDCGIASTNCSPPSGSTFSLGPTTVTCTASDAAGNMSSCTFTVTLTSTAACSFAIAPTSQEFSVSGGSNSIAVTASDSCAWTAVSNDDWITITSGNSGTGSGTVNYSVAANTGPARVGTMTIAGQTFTVSQSAVTPSSCGVIVLDPAGRNALQMSGGATLDLPDCLVAVNSSNNSALTSSGNADITAREIDITGDFRATGHSAANLHPSPLTGVAPTPDPFAGLPAPSTNGLPVFSGGTIPKGSVLQPGVYENQIEVHGGSVVQFSPGLYILKNGINVSSSTIQGNGVTLYNEGNLTFSGRSMIRLTPPDSGTYAGITVFQAREDTEMAMFSGGSASLLAGGFYFPSAELTLSGGSNIKLGSLVVWRLSLTGGSSGSQ
jgi:hypothetical protein